LEKPLLEVQDLKIYYRTSTSPVKAVDGVTFSVRKGEIFGIAGESGCGKSTLALGLLKLIMPPAYIAGGKVLYDGINLYDMNEEDLRRIRWKRISFLPQASMNALNPVMTIYDQIRDVIETHEGRRAKEDIKSKIFNLLRSVLLPHRVVEEYPCNLSGGMKQRVIIAMAVALNPELIVADEPTSALDVTVQRGVLESLVDLKEKYGSSIILITHDLAILSEVADRAAIIYAGKIVEIQEIIRLFEEPLHPYTQGLIASIPSFKEKIIPKSIPGLPPDLKNPPKGCRFQPRCTKFIDKCKSEEPKFKEIEDGRFVACHLY
jgi:peptide/nickel transport system ATP-binding protein